MWFFKKKKKEEMKEDVKEEKVEEKESAVVEDKSAVETKKSEKNKAQNNLKNTPKKNDKSQKSDAKNTPKNEKEDKTKEEEVTNLGVYRVLYSKEEKLWLIKRDGAKRTIASYKTKEQALLRVSDLCKNQNAKVIVHKKDGKFQKKTKNLKV